jgi:protein phosphatase methylesterase 1
LNNLGGSEEGPIVVFLHGGGYSGLTWAPLNQELTRLVQCQTLAIDLRGHGCTYTEDDYDLSAVTMATDIANVLATHTEDIDNPEIILIGHRYVSIA